MPPSRKGRSFRPTPAGFRPSSPGMTPTSHVNAMPAWSQLNRQGEGIMFIADRFHCQCWDLSRSVKWCEHIEDYFEEERDVGQYQMAWSRAGFSKDLMLPLANGFTLVKCTATLVALNEEDPDSELALLLVQSDNPAVTSILSQEDGLREFIAGMNYFYAATKEYEDSFFMMERKGLPLCRNDKHNGVDTRTARRAAGQSSVANFAVANAHSLITVGGCWACHMFNSLTVSGAAYGLEDFQ